MWGLQTLAPQFSTLTTTIVFNNLIAGHVANQPVQLLCQLSGLEFARLHHLAINLVRKAVQKAEDDKKVEEEEMEEEHQAEEEKEEEEQEVEKEAK